MARKQFSNNALTTLASSISAVANSCSATSGGGSLFPAITSGSGNSFQMTFLKIVSGAVTAQEIVTVTARTGDVLSITRAQEGTTALSWNAGDQMALLPTAGDLTAFMQAGDIQAQTGNYAQDTGVANAYVAAVTPALAAHLVGAPIVWKASNTNTGASTFNDGFGTANLLAPDLLPLAAGMIEAGGIYESVWDGAQFQVLSPWVLTIAETFATAAAAAAVAPVSANFASGTFLATLSGMAGSVTMTCTYRVSNGICNISGPGATGTSNSIAMSMSGLPSPCIPASFSAQAVPVQVTDLASAILGGAFLTAGSSVVGFGVAVTNNVANRVLVGLANFTASGIKGLPVGFSFSYPVY